MKTLLLLIGQVLMMFLPSSVNAQTNFQLYIDGNYYSEGSTVYFKCNNLTSTVNARYEYNSNFVNQVTVSRADVIAPPSGYTFTNQFDVYTLEIHKSTPQDGDFSIILHGAYLPSGGHTITVHFRTSPVISFNSLPSLGNNQSGTVQVYINPSYNPYNPYTSVNYTTDYGLRVNGNTSYSNGNTGDYNSAPISTLSTGGNLYVTATNACGVSPAISANLGTPYINPGPLSLFDAYSNIWQFTQGVHPVATYSFYVAAGSASLTPNYGDCYIQTSGGADVCVTGTNSNGTGGAYCFNVPAGGGGYMRAVSPNPAREQLSLQFKDTKSLKTLPSDIYLYAENSTKAVRSVAVKDVYEQKAFEDGDKIKVSVSDLPRGTYYLHIIPNQDSKQPIQKIRIILE